MSEAEPLIDDGNLCVRHGDKDRLHTWEDHLGRIWCGGLFYMHDTEGFPLACSLDQCAERRMLPTLIQFVFDAIRAGWPKERAIRTVREALSDCINVPTQWHDVIRSFNDWAGK